MFDIGWSEMAIIALVALIVIGPKDLPRAMKTVAQWMRKARSLTREFQSGIDEMVREAELEDARKALEATRRGNLERTISNAVDPEGEMEKEVRNVEREAGREDSEATAKPAEGNAEKAAAKMVTQPVSVAPAHSLSRPADRPAGDKPAADAPAAGKTGEAGEKLPAPDSKQSA